MTITPPARDPSGLKAQREAQAVWRCAIGDATTALDMLKNKWLSSSRRAEREAGAELAKLCDLIWAARNPAAADYQQAFDLGKALTERVRNHLTRQETK